MKLPVVLLHGWGQHPAVWHALLDALPAERQYINLPLPGYAGSTGSAADYPLQTLIDSFAVQLPPRFHLVGWSLGGTIALAIAQQHAQRIASLTLISTTPCFGEQADWPHGSPAATQNAFAALIATDPQGGMQRFAELMLIGEADPRPSRRQLRALLGETRPAPDILQAGLHLLAETDLRASIVKTPPAMPSLLVHGEGDTITPIAAAHWLADRLPAARTCYLPDCGHAPLLSHVAPLAAAMIRLLDDTE